MVRACCATADGLPCDCRVVAMRWPCDPHVSPPQAGDLAELQMLTGAGRGECIEALLAYDGDANAAAAKLLGL